MLREEFNALRMAEKHVNVLLNLAAASLVSDMRALLESPEALRENLLARSGRFAQLIDDRKKGLTVTLQRNADGAFCLALVAVRSEGLLQALTNARARCQGEIAEALATAAETLPLRFVLARDGAAGRAA